MRRAGSRLALLANWSTPTCHYRLRMFEAPLECVVESDAVRLLVARIQAGRASFASLSDASTGWSSLARIGARARTHWHASCSVFELMSDLVEIAGDACSEG